MLVYLTLFLFFFFLICLPQQQRKYVDGGLWQSFSISASAVLGTSIHGYLIYICLSKRGKEIKDEGWEEERKEERKWITERG